MRRGVEKGRTLAAACIERPRRQREWSPGRQDRYSHPFNTGFLASERMRPYLTAARRYRWLLATIVALIWGAGLVGAYVEYTSTYDSRATIWVLRRSPDLTITSPDDPNAAIVQTA